MAFKGRSAILAIGTLGLALVGHDAWATGGYFSHGYGTDHKALAGAGAALSLTTQSVATRCHHRSKAAHGDAAQATPTQRMRGRQGERDAQSLAA
jgi:hypothetical protein